MEDYETVATVPLQAQKRKQLSYPASAFRSDVDTTFKTAPTSSQRTPAYVTQPTQPLQHATQPTQPLPKRPFPPTSEVLVERSSPARVPSPKPIAGLTARPFQKRSGLLASLAPAGTNFRAPPNVQPRPQTINLDDSEEEEEDQPIHHSSDDETQALSSNIKPTNFTRGGRGLDSTPNRVDRSDKPSSEAVRESPTNARTATTTVHASSNTFFGNLMKDFGHSDSRPPPPRRPADDMASAYGGMSRAPRSQMPRQTAPARAQPVNAVRYKTIDDVQDYVTRNKITYMRSILGESESIDRCHEALSRNKGNAETAMVWLSDNEVRRPAAVNDVDELGTMSPVLKRGVALKTSSSHMPSSQPVKPSAKQEVKASKSIAERYAGPQAQAQRKLSKPAVLPQVSDEEEEEEVQPRRRLLKGRKPGRSPTPPSSPPAQKPTQPKQRLQQRQKAIVIDDDDYEFDSGIGRGESEEVEEQVQETTSDLRLLNFFNECSTRDLAELSAQPEATVEYVLSKRPFASLDVVRAISNAPEMKNGKKSRARPVGEKIVETASEMWAGYEAVDDLVAACEKISGPIQKALKGWGGNREGELQLMNLDEAQDSGIGTPASSCPSDEVPSAKARKPKGNFLGQPESMDNVEMKDYQLVGLNWLNFLFEKRISCILADDMGLGKTCQVIAFLAHLEQMEVDGVHLVIVPGSTLENWLNEFKRFAPSLNVFPYYAGDKDREGLRYRIEEEFHTIDVIVTTYDVAVKEVDNKFLRKQVQPLVCVFDEAHALRNPKSQRYENLSRIRADFRLLLTGTPLQNNLQELVAILAFIMPDLFEEKREQLEYIFKHKATTKNADHAALLSAERIARARTMMTPFILRRKKAQVLDLPTKHSRIEWCDMTASQTAFYNHMIAEAQRVLSEEPTTVRAKAAATKASSNIIMSLRQAAIHPLLRRHLYTDKKIDRIVAELRKHDEFGENPPEKIRDYLVNESNTGVNLKGGDYALHNFCSDRPYLQKFVLKKQEWMDCGKVQKFKELVSTLR